MTIPTSSDPRDKQTMFAAAPTAAASFSVPHAVQTALAPNEIVILLLRPSILYVPLSSLGTLAASVVIATTLAYAATLKRVERYRSWHHRGQRSSRVGVA